MNGKHLVATPIWKVEKDSIKPIEDFLICESSLDIYVNGEFLTGFKCLPGEPGQLALGFLVSEGFLVHPSELNGVRLERDGLSIQIDITVPRIRMEAARDRLSHLPGVDPVERFRQHCRDLLLESPIICEPKAATAKLSTLYDIFIKGSVTFQRAGSVHSAGLSDGAEMICHAEDISRHNAVDRVIGEAFLRGLDLSRLILFTTGRLPCDMIAKIVMARIPFCVTRSAPTAQALRLAQDFGLTICGRMGEERMTVFCRPERVTDLPVPTSPQP